MRTVLFLPFQYGFLFLALLIGWNLKYIAAKVMSECGHSAVHLILERRYSVFHEVLMLVVVRVQLSQISLN